MEIEAKYRITGPVTPAAVTDLPLEGYVIEPAGEEHISDELIDTDGRRLSSAGFALRRRTGDRGTRVTLKGGGTVTGAVHARDEMEFDLSPEEPEQWPPAILDLIRPLVADATLQVIAQVANHRRYWNVRRDGDLVAEIALDEGIITAGDLVEPFHEMELELKEEGSEAVLMEIAGLLERALPLEPESNSKFGRALALLQRQERAMAGDLVPIRDPGTRPVIDVGREVILKNLDRLKAAEPVAREGVDPEGVHQLRVATRRLRAALSILEETVADPVVTRRFRRDLRALANSAGSVRDADVFAGHVLEYAESLEDEDERQGLGPLLALLAAQRELGQKEMLRTLDAKATRKLLTELRRWAQKGAVQVRPSKDGGPQPVWIRHFVRSALWRRYEEILAYETVMPAPAPVLHRLRVTCKRFRYSLEFFEEVMGDEGRWLTKRLAQVQEHLGQIQDADVAIQMIRTVARARQGTAALQAYRDERRAEETRLVEAFGADWEALTGLEFRERLSAALADL